MKLSRWTYFTGFSPKPWLLSADPAHILHAKVGEDRMTMRVPFASQGRRPEHIQTRVPINSPPVVHLDMEGHR